MLPEVSLMPTMLGISARSRMRGTVKATPPAIGGTLYRMIGMPPTFFATYSPEAG